MNIGTVSEQHLHDLGMLLRDRPHERRLAPCTTRVHVGALGDQLLYNCSIARAGGDHDGCFAGQQGGVRIGAGIKRRRTITSLPFWLAVHSGVTPRSLAVFILAPARINRPALSTSSR